MSIHYPHGFLIGIGGQARMGKDTTADYLSVQLTKQTHTIWQKASFAQNVKRIFSETFGVSLGFIEQYKSLSDIPPGFNLNIRQGLQIIGGGFREIQSDVWIRLFVKHNQGNCIIADVRYENELKFVKSNKGVNILVVRPSVINTDPHSSERVMWQCCHWAAHFPDGCYETKKNQKKSMPELLKLFDYFIVCDEGVPQLHGHANQVIPGIVEKFNMTKTKEKKHVP